ncbi:MAG: hypothetical protein JSV88_32865 [Candidatus Aminicenantes bacterium]|nr:MAG: hypothetical protein JSV88_32865 [Candidatus Aminicenantes bacterium]
MPLPINIDDLITGQDKVFKENGTVSGTVNEIQKKILEEIEKKSSISYEQLA